MQSNLDKSELDLSGVAKSPLPKLAPADRARVKRVLESTSGEYDPVVALRLALAAKLPIRLEWRTEAVVDMALDTRDIAKRIIDLAEGQLMLKFPAVLTVLERRSRTSPIPVFRAICTIVLPGKKRKPAKYSNIWDEETAIRVGRLLIQILPAVFSGKLGKAVKPAEQVLMIAKDTLLLHPSAETASIAIDLLAGIEHEASWQALDTPSAREIIELILNLPSKIAQRLLEYADLQGLYKLTQGIKSLKEADNKLREYFSDLNGLARDALPLVSRQWIAKYLGAASDSEAEPIGSAKSSDAALERLALILITTWDARQDGEKSSYAFNLLREILASGFGLFVVGEVGRSTPFDSTLHESRGPLVLGEPVILVRPWIEYRQGEDIQVMIKGMVERIGR